MAKASIVLDLIKLKKTNLFAFEKSIDVAHSQLKTTIDRGSDLSVMFINKILVVYPEISEHWLLTGKGPILKKDALQLQLAKGITMLADLKKEMKTVEKQIDEIKSRLEEHFTDKDSGRTKSKKSQKMK